MRREGKGGFKRGGRLIAVEVGAGVLTDLIVALVLPAPDGEQRLEPIVGLPLHSDTAIQEIRAADALARHLTIAFLPGAAVVRLDGDPGVEAVSYRAADEALNIGGREVADGHIHSGLERIGWLVRDIVDRTAGGVVAEQGPLRSLQHFYALQVERRAAGED